MPDPDYDPVTLPVYQCRECGAITTNTDSHTDWHDFLEAAG